MNTHTGRNTHAHTHSPAQAFAQSPPFASISSTTLLVKVRMFAQKSRGLGGGGPGHSWVGWHWMRGEADVGHQAAWQLLPATHWGHQDTGHVLPPAKVLLRCSGTPTSRNTHWQGCLDCVESADKLIPP